MGRMNGFLGQSFPNRVNLPGLQFHFLGQEFPPEAKKTCIFFNPSPADALCSYPPLTLLQRSWHTCTV